jgi:hypothetical protein
MKLTGDKLITLWADEENGVHSTCEYDTSFGRYVVTVTKGSIVLTETFPDGYVPFSPTLEDTHKSIDIAEHLIKKLEEENVSN